MVRVALLRRLQQGLQLRLVPLHRVERRVQVLGQGQGRKLGGDGGGGGQRGEFGAGEEDLFFGG